MLEIVFIVFINHPSICINNYRSTEDTNMNQISQVVKILKEQSNQGNDLSLLNAPLLQKITTKMRNSEELVFLLPAFPAKSPSPLKTLGELPDLGEVLALEGLQSICAQISNIYNPGAKIIICSDGRVFSDVVNVSDETINNYQIGIENIIKEFNFNHIELFSLDDLYPDLKKDKLREVLLERFGKDIDEVKSLVCANEEYNRLFNGLHRFLIEDELGLNPLLTKNQAKKMTKSRTYELIRRSDAWSELINFHFQDHLRLSIHSYPAHHEKFGIKLVASSSKWATPWHNVTVKIKDKFELMHLQEALKLNATLKMLKDKYAYFEITEA